MLSSISRRETILEAVQLGANDYLLKRHDLLGELPRRVTRHALR
jgi:DNA-binding NarL/FixJ family response regulator